MSIHRKDDPKMGYERIPNRMESLEQSYTDAQAEIARLKAANEKMRGGLEYIAYGKAHIGNDANGNVFGPPDAVMCRNRAIQALTP